MIKGEAGVHNDSNDDDADDRIEGQRDRLNTQGTEDVDEEEDDDGEESEDEDVRRAREFFGARWLNRCQELNPEFGRDWSVLVPPL